MTIRVRFAPSNTGTLHIGGARTALYNWLWARRNKGTFLLRIEDTDLERSKPEFTDNILASLKWLGIDWDEGPSKGGPYGPYFQTERAKAGIYKPYIDKLMSGGGIYRCFCSKERLASLKVHDENASYDRKCRSIPRDEAEKRARAGEPNVIRIKLPETEIRFDDGIKGPQRWDPKDMSDEVIIRSDGSPMYNFVVVCDDLGMKITDVIRGEDHLSNTPKQVAIYRALGAETPRFAHIPLIFGPNGKKLSKRAPVLAGKTAKGDEVYVAKSKDDPNAWEVIDVKTGAKSLAPKADVVDLRQVMSQVDEYREAGYLPEAVLNYLVLLGWGYDDKTEIFTKDELVEKFDIKKVSSSAAQFDPRKLEHFQGVYIRKLPDDRVSREFAAELQRAGLLPRELGADDKARLELLTKAEKERVRFFHEIVEKSRPFFVDQVDYDAKALENLKKPGVPGLLGDYAKALEQGNFADSKALEEQARGFAKERNVKFGELVHPVRAALTGTTVGAGLFDVMRLCGKKRALERLRRAADFLKPS